MRLTHLVGSLFLLFCIAFLSACEKNITNEDLAESLEVFSGLEQVPEASDVVATINRGDAVQDEGWFMVDLQNIGPNQSIQNGLVGAWCLEWKKPLRSNNDSHSGIKLYSTAGSDKWKPINYLFSIKEELRMNDETLTNNDFQAVIWTLAGDMGIASEFNVDNVAIHDLPSRMVTDGEPNFSRAKVKAIVSRVKAEYAASKSKIADDTISSGFVAETSGDEQDVFIPGDPADPCDEDVIDFNKVDVMLLFDDTGSFANYVDDVAALFPDIIGQLETAFPDKDFAFGVSRFEDYGGTAGRTFSGEYSTGRPFILNQPLVTQSAAGGAAARNTLISSALSRTAPGYGGDGPETAYHGLYELATGAGFDGDGNGSTTDSGNAGETATQISPGTSGDVPSFSTNTLPTSGTLGGAGWRTDAQKIVILATDVCSVAPFDAAEGIPTEITGQPGTSEAISRLVCSSFLGSNRYGFISDAKSTSGNTVADAVVPSEVATVQESVDALTSFGIQVVGLSTTGGATSATGPSTSPSVFLSALANLTGALDSDGNPLVFGISASASSIAAGIVDAVGTSACDATTTSMAKLSRFSDQLRATTTTADDDTTRYSNYVIFE